MNAEPLRIVIAASEAVPFSKTGGLADVASALAVALGHRGAAVSLFVPAHSMHGRDLPAITPMELTFPVRVGDDTVQTYLRRTHLPDSGVPVFLIDQPYYFARGGLYGEHGTDYTDNCARFSFFSRAVMEAVDRLDLRPHVVHANDWQTGLIPVLLDDEFRHRGSMQHTASVFTIHNLAYQGQFDQQSMALTGVDWRYFNWQQMESWGQLNLLKSGITLADRVTTVSPTYAAEIQTEEFGCGLESVLQHHRDKLSGILNGIDTAQWNPATDPLISHNFDVDSFEQTKPKCKRVLQERFGLPQRDDAMLVGMVSRMSTQKGFDIIGHAASRFLQHNLQLCVLGTGDPSCEQMCQALQKQHPDKVSVCLAFDEQIAHQVEAGADLFLMPSRYEPCGLNQMYSLTYGTVPLVRATGGLADSVVDATPENLQQGRATGFSFQEYSAHALADTFDRAMALFGDRTAWNAVVETGMRQDWSWERSAQQYEHVYREAMQTRP